MKFEQRTTYLEDTMFHNSAIESALLNLWMNQAVVTVKTASLEITDHIEYLETTGAFLVAGYAQYIKFTSDSVLSIDFSSDSPIITVRS